MARAKVRSNVYAAMPILACLIMAFGIYFTWARLAEYDDPNMKPVNVPKPKLASVIKADPVPDAAPTDATRPATDAKPKTDGEAPDEGAPEDVAPPAKGGTTPAAPPAGDGPAGKDDREEDEL